MNIYIIKVSMANGALEFDPDECAIEKNAEKSLIVWMLDDSLKGETFNPLGSEKPGFKWGKSSAVARRIFKKLNINDDKKCISIEDHHVFSNDDSANTWSYEMHTAKYKTAIHSALDSKKEKRRRRPPVIINK